MKREDILKVLAESNKILSNYTDKQNEWFESSILKDNGIFAATKVNNQQGQKNAESGHMKSIQKIGCSIGGKVSASRKPKEHFIEIGKLGNEANQQKHGIRIIATNLNTNECWEYISISEAERDTNTQAPIIRKILRGEQTKTRSGWTFYKK
jgi:hypothetical protein